MKRILATLLLTGLVMQAHAQQDGILIKTSSIYFGGGLGFNTLPAFGSATGIQALIGYEFDFRLNGDIATALELGYMDSGNFKSASFIPGVPSSSATDATGVWLNVVETVPMSDRFSGLVRAGVDFGDDDGLMVGAGLGYAFNRQFSLRTEYVKREEIGSFQFNVIIRL